MSTIKCRILSIKCFRETEPDGDEIYLKVNGLKIWPQKKKWHRVKSNEEVVVSETLQLQNSSGEISIDLWEYDFLNDDHLGSFDFKVDSIGGPYSTDLKTKKSAAKYNLVWEAYV